MYKRKDTEKDDDDNGGGSAGAERNDPIRA